MLTLETGLHCQVVRVSYGGGHICLLSHDELRCVPTKVPDLPLLLQLLLSIWRMKVSALPTPIRKTTTYQNRLENGERLQGDRGRILR